MLHLGIDYGSKLAGTTAICVKIEGHLDLFQSGKKQDADLFISKIIHQYQPKKVFIDAPLSLPLAYYDEGKDFFYRDCDRKLKAMSPMFLGGLTARAMKLKSLHPKCIFIETYPKALVQTFENHKDFYLKKEKINSKAITKIEQEIPFKLKQSIKSWHQFDAILAWLSGYRYSKNLHQTIGNPKEGLIIF